MWWLDRVSQSLLSFLLSIERRQSGNTHTPSPPHIYIRYADFLDNASDFDLYDATDSHTEGITEGCTATEIINSCSPPPPPHPSSRPVRKSFRSGRFAFRDLRPSTRLVRFVFLPFFFLSRGLSVVAHLLIDRTMDFRRTRVTGPHKNDVERGFALDLMVKMTRKIVRGFGLSCFTLVK